MKVMYPISNCQLTMAFCSTYVAAETLLSTAGDITLTTTQQLCNGSVETGEEPPTVNLDIKKLVIGNVHSFAFADNLEIWVKCALHLNVKVTFPCSDFASGVRGFCEYVNCNTVH